MAKKIYRYKRGDIVKVVKKAYEQGNWTPEMDDYVGDGDLYTVTDVWDRNSICLNEGFRFHPNALELVKEAPITNTPNILRTGITVNVSGTNWSWNGERWI